MRSWVMRMDAERSELARFGLLWVSRVLDFGRPSVRPSAPAVGRRRVLCLFCLFVPPSHPGGIMPVQVRRAVLCGGARLLGRRVAMSVDLETPMLLMRRFI